MLHNVFATTLEVGDVFENGNTIVAIENAQMSDEDFEESDVLNRDVVRVTTADGATFDLSPLSTHNLRSTAA